MLSLSTDYNFAIVRYYVFEIPCLWENYYVLNDVVLYYHILYLFICWTRDDYVEWFNSFLGTRVASVKRKRQAKRDRKASIGTSLLEPLRKAKNSLVSDRIVTLASLIEQWSSIITYWPWISLHILKVLEVNICCTNGRLSLVITWSDADLIKRTWIG